MKAVGAVVVVVAAAVAVAAVGLLVELPLLPVVKNTNNITKVNVALKIDLMCGDVTSLRRCSEAAAAVCLAFSSS